MFKSKNADIISSRRVVACTTTAAAKYAQELQAASRDVLLVEEAGEILESHVLTALGPKTQQLVLIGDHKQLRPKLNSYSLSVEKGEGYDLNRSLFERLILKGYPHQVLNEQHRMRPAISSLIRALTYPGLIDAPSTQGRPAIRGLQDNLVFLTHVSLSKNRHSIQKQHILLAYLWIPRHVFYLLFEREQLIPNVSRLDTRMMPKKRRIGKI